MKVHSHLEFCFLHVLSTFHFIFIYFVSNKWYAIIKNLVEKWNEYSRRQEVFMNTKVMTNLILLITVFELKCTYIWCYLEFQKYFRSCWGQSCIPWKESLKAQEYWHRFWKLVLEKNCTVIGLYVEKKSVQW